MLMCIATSNIEAKQESQMIKTEECTWGGGGGSNSSNGRINGNYISRIKLRKYYEALSDAQQAWKNIIVKVRKK